MGLRSAWPRRGQKGANEATQTTAPTLPAFAKSY